MEHAIGHAGGVLILAVLGLIGAALVGYGRARLMHQTFSSAFYIFAFAFGIFLMVLVLFSAVVWLFARLVQNQKSLTNTQEPSTPQPKLTIRIDKGYCGERRSDPQTTAILLRILVDGPPTAIVRWGLKLTYRDTPWFTGYEPIIGTALFRPEGHGVPEEPLEAIQIPEKVPDRGWLLFTRAFSKEFRERHIFGAVFTLTAIESNGVESFHQEVPGEWLHRADIYN